MAVTPFFGDNHEQSHHSISLFDERHISLAKNSLILAGGTTCLCLAVGISLAFLIYKTDLWGRSLFYFLYIIPVLIPPYIHAIVWSHLNPLVERFLSTDIHSLFGAVFILILTYFPFVTLTTISGLKSIDRNIEEASLLCCGTLHTLRYITLPLVIPHIFAGAAFVFIFSITNFSVPDILRVNVYPVEIFIQFSAFYNEKAATILSFPLIAITLLLIIVQRWYMKDRSYVQVSGGSSETVKYSLRWLNIVAFSFCFLVIGFSVAVPLVVLLKVSGSLASYLRVLNTSIDQIAYSLILSCCGAIVTLFIAFFLSYLIEKVKTKTHTLISLIYFIPLAIPATTLGIGLIKVWNRPLIDYVYGNSLIIIFGYIARYIPIAVIIIFSGLKQLHKSLEEAAFLITPYWREVMRKIVIPLLKNSLVAGFFILFILSLGELGTTLLVIPPGKETVPIKIYNLMHYGAEQMVAALCLILIVIIMAFSGLFLLLQNKFLKKVQG